MPTLLANAALAILGAVLGFHQVPVPANIASPQVPSFELAGFRVHGGGHDTDTQTPQYLSETENMRAAALITESARFASRSARTPTIRFRFGSIIPSSAGDLVRRARYSG
jgi:hypothetical protein